MPKESGRCSRAWRDVLGAALMTMCLPLGATGSGGLIEDRTIGPDALVLPNSTSWIVNDLVVRDGTTIKTQGHNFTIVVNGNLTIEGTLTIHSFGPEDAPEEPLKATSGAEGTSYKPGPATDGRCASCPGRDGGPGQCGKQGPPGVPGRAAGVVNLTVLGGASGALVVRNVGMNGGTGGVGGDGGRGGDGEQGGHGTPYRIAFGIIAGCKAAPGLGGNGGTGGSAGDGGNGGRGGRGGDVIIVLQGSHERFSLKVDTAGGHPGQPGEPGVSGPGGEQGYGGRGSTGCIGREVEQRGEHGLQGQAGRSGQQAEAGLAGIVQANVPHTSSLAGSVTP